MAYRLTATVLVLAALALWTGCEKDRDSVVVIDPEQDRVEWAVLVYASGNYSGDVMNEPVEEAVSRAVSTLHVMERTELPSSITAFACMSSAETNGNVGIYQVDLSRREQDELVGSARIAALGNVSMADPNVLINFINTALDHASPQAVVLTVIGDGSGWNGVLSDNVDQGGMSLHEFHEAINAVESRLPGGRFDLLNLNCRNMGSIETLYELREHAEYMVTTPWQFEQPQSKVISNRYRHLSVRPDFDAELLGQYVIDAERLAQDTSEVEVFGVLWEMDRLPDVMESVSDFAAEWAAVAPDHAVELTTLRNEAAPAELYDGNTIDIARYADLILLDETFLGTPLESAALQVKNSVEAMTAARFGSSNSLPLGGLSVYYPSTEIDTTTARAYGELEFAASAPRWAEVIDSLANRGNATVIVTGRGFYPNRSFHDVKFYADTLLGGQFSVVQIGEPEWHCLNANCDTIEFTAEFDLQSTDSLVIEFGLLIDRDDNGAISSQDSLGGWNDGSGTWTPFTIQRGETYSDRDVLVRLRRQ